MKTIFNFFLLTLLLASCSKKPTEQNSTDSVSLSTATSQKTPQELMQEIDNQIVNGDSLLFELGNEESLEGGMDKCYFDENLTLKKTIRENYGETYNNIDEFYFDENNNLFAVTSERSNYNKSVYDESETPLKATSQGKYIIFLDKNQIKTYIKAKNKRKFEDKTEAQEADYWIKRATASAKQFETNKESDFYEKFTQLQYDETKNSPIHIYKLRDKMYCLNNFDDEVFKSTRFDKIKTPNLGIIELTYKPETSGWYQTKSNTFFQSSAEIQVSSKAEVANIENQNYLYFSYQLFENGKISNYYTVFNPNTFSATSLIISNGKTNEATIANKVIRDFLIAKSK